MSGNLEPQTAPELLCSNVARSLRCVHCEEYFDSSGRRPRFLECRHSICEACASCWLRAAGFVKCNHCDAETEVGGRNVDALAVDEHAYGWTLLLTKTGFQGQLRMMNVPRLLAAVRQLVENWSVVGDDISVTNTTSTLTSPTRTNSLRDENVASVGAGRITRGIRVDVANHSIEVPHDGSSRGSSPGNLDPQLGDHSSARFLRNQFSVDALFPGVRRVPSTVSSPSPPGSVGTGSSGSGSSLHLRGPIPPSSGSSGSSVHLEGPLPPTGSSPFESVPRSSVWDIRGRRWVADTGFQPGRRPAAGFVPAPAPGAIGLSRSVSEQDLPYLTEVGPGPDGAGYSAADVVVRPNLPHLHGYSHHSDLNDGYPRHRALPDDNLMSRSLRLTTASVPSLQTGPNFALPDASVLGRRRVGFAHDAADYAVLPGSGGSARGRQTSAATTRPNEGMNRSVRRSDGVPGRCGTTGQERSSLRRTQSVRSGWRPVVGASDDGSRAFSDAGTARRMDCDDDRRRRQRRGQRARDDDGGDDVSWSDGGWTDSGSGSETETGMDSDSRRNRVPRRRDSRHPSSTATLTRNGRSGVRSTAAAAARRRSDSSSSAVFSGNDDVAAAGNMNPVLARHAVLATDLRRFERNFPCSVCNKRLCGPSPLNDAFMDKRSLVRLRCALVLHHHCAVSMASGRDDCLFRCPNCDRMHGTRFGNQPQDGQMRIQLEQGGESLPGFDRTSVIIIEYMFRSGVQGPNHPSPGTHYEAMGFPRRAFLPCTRKGYEVLCMLKIAFDRRLIFTVGTSETANLPNCLVWAGIRHKTLRTEGLHGYPDPNYLDRVTGDLERVGVTPEDIPARPEVAFGIGFTF